ncbi:hypothetical protein D3C72_1579110 [compost metagenome]
MGIVGAIGAAKPTTGALPEAKLAGQQLAIVRRRDRAGRHRARLARHGSRAHGKVSARADGRSDRQCATQPGIAHVADLDVGAQVRHGWRAIGLGLRPGTSPKRHGARRKRGSARRQGIRKAEGGASNAARRFRPHSSAIPLGCVNDGGNADQVGGMRPGLQHRFDAIDQRVDPASLARAGFALGDVDLRREPHRRALRKIGRQVGRCAQFGNRGCIGIHKQ